MNNPHDAHKGHAFSLTSEQHTALLAWFARHPLHAAAINLVNHLLPLIVTRGLRQRSKKNQIIRTFQFSDGFVLFRVPVEEDTSVLPGALPCWCAIYTSPETLVFLLQWHDVPDVGFELSYFARGDWEKSLRAEQAHSAAPAQRPKRLH